MFINLFIIACFEHENKGNFAIAQTKELKN